MLGYEKGPAGLLLPGLREAVSVGCVGYRLETVTTE